jgi:hypothetical protein
MKGSHTKTSITSLVVIVLMLLLVASLTYAADGSQNAPNMVGNKGEAAEPPAKPMIIWWARLEDDHETLRLAISSGIFSHVMLRGLHRFDRPDYSTNSNLKKALNLCKKKGVKVIWTRWLYPGYEVNNFRFEDIFDAQYYVQQLREIRKEAKLMGIDLVAFDAEPYGNSPLKPLKLYPPRKLSETEFNALNNAVKNAIKVEGQVDFILPAGTGLPRHLYNATRSLGKLVIAEHTYRDIPAKIKDKRRPYDIFGAYVSVTKKDPTGQKTPVFTPKEILERQTLWAHKKGLFVYPSHVPDISAAVALEFSKIKTIRPVSDSNDAH